jgi:two-component system, cell cycle sensor histidine kinase and response regulator CckA
MSKNKRPADVSSTTTWEEAIEQAVYARPGIQEHFHSQILDSFTEAVVVTNLESRILYWNRGAERMYGYAEDEVLNRPYHEFAGSMTRKDEESFRAALLETGAWQGEHMQRRRDGSTFWTATHISILRDASGEPAGFIGVDYDITERKATEEAMAHLQAQLNHAQKMESVGRLAGGVAHDFNNMLGVIIGHADLAIDTVGTAHPLHDELLEIRKAALRSADLTRQLLAFARKQTSNPRVLDLNQTVSGMLRMLGRLIGENIRLDWRPGDEVPPVFIDPGQMDQILANLCVNARDAIPGQGIIRIHTERVHWKPEQVRRHPGLKPGYYALLCISDNGCGMSPETLEHMFEPFYTTKEPGKGTGLGLATVYGIVSQNHGSIEVTSEVGRGTSFHIHLPAHDEAPQAVPAGPETPLPGGRGHQTILLVEDEQAILDMVSRVLGRQGYRVLSAHSPADALEQAGKHGDGIDLLLTDVIMPGMNGRELAEELRKKHPTLPCILMSGYTAEIIAGQELAENRIRFLQKPFSIRTLLDAVDATLIESQQAAAQGGL